MGQSFWRLDSVTRGANNLNMDKQNKRCFYILVPVYNVEKYIVECIESVLNQIYKNWKLILVDDGSTDLSGNICDKYGDGNCKISVIHKPNGGSLSARQAARNYLFEQGGNENDYALYLDSDDLLESDALYEINNIIESTGSDLIVYKYRRFVESKELPEIDNQNRSYEIIEDKAILYKKVFTDAGYNSLCRKAIKINLVGEEDYSEYFQIEHSEDLLQSILLYKNAKRVLFSEAELYRYRMNPTSITHTVTYENFQVSSTVRNEVLSFLKKENIWTESDYVYYFTYCKACLKNDVRLIAGFKTHKKNRFKLFDDILADNYYKMVLKYTKKKDCILNSLKRKNYNTVLFICSLYRVAAAVKRIFRK